MANDKARGIDGFPCDFYKALWDCVGQDLYHVYLEGFHAKSLGNLINKGNIKSIPKFCDPEDICNWRPIMILNFSYKIITKALALKIHHLLLQIVHSK